ncbi:hypothetical protein BDB00DRAFT_879772 [Zychaea mexicana]|uniref:uncharacterized protein n=1 Tax=Zychaea mexicana TaxID=64656 RepID=UPI0022FDB2F5|nr:uncharacterized protein BDB00DRAFT_879772 [Zychaea mexicana]KAI9472943.1 hypothetical protein BDB00DRAFT_879772 [Zychaea mexicana]
MNARKSIEIGQRINTLVQSLQKTPLRKAVCPTRLRPGSLEAKVAASPYASILASPLRHCAFHQRRFPSQMLLRFGLERSSKSAIYPFPEVGLKKPAGLNDSKRYVRLRRPVLDVVARNGSRAIFRGQTEFKKDTMEEIGRELIDYVYAHYDSSNFIRLKQLLPGEWCKDPSFSNDTTTSTQFQCILLLSTPSSNDDEGFCQMDHHINGMTPSIPCYDISKLWKEKSDPSHPMPENGSKDEIIAYGVPKHASTVKLAVALWRCRAFFS